MNNFATKNRKIDKRIIPKERNNELWAWIILSSSPAPKK